MEFAFQLFLWKHLGLIAGNVDAAFLKFEQFDVLSIFIYITRDILANIETLRSIATDKQIVVFAEVFEVPVGNLFPPKRKSSGRIVGLKS